MKVLISKAIEPECSVTYMAALVIMGNRLFLGEIISDSRLTVLGLERVDTRDVINVLGRGLIGIDINTETIVTKDEARMVRATIHECTPL